jgi:DNA primase
MNPVLDIANEYLERVRPTGDSNIIAVCPFHDDSDPSFAMSTVTGLWICYACGAKGNLKQFLDRLEIDRQTIQLKHGEALKKVRNNRKPEANPTASLTTKDPLPEEILGLFNMCPTSLLDAGFEESTLRFFEIGFDKLHMRVTYPMRDLKGQLLGINGRTVEEDEDIPRYKVYTKEYEAWGMPPRNVVNKSLLLWNAHNLYPYIKFLKTPEFVVLVEGYKACMWVHQGGFPDVMAVQGRSLSKEQKWILEKIGCPVYLMFDNNEAGWGGMGKAGEDLSKSMLVKIVQYEAEQPDGVPQNEVSTTVRNAVEFRKFKSSLTLE